MMVKKFVLILICIALFYFYFHCGGKKPNPVQRQVVFHMEYDCQASYNVFDRGDQKAYDAFYSANTVLSIHHSDEFLADSTVDFDSVPKYISWQWDTISGSVEEGYPKLRYSSYMMAMQDATNKPEGELGEELLGYTSGSEIAGRGPCGYVNSVIFVQAIRNNYLGDLDMIDYVSIHEMGHMRGDLTELCDEYRMMRDEHNDSSCVMGQGKHPICTGKDVSANPHFCPMCIEKLKQVLWEWP